MSWLRLTCAASLAVAAAACNLTVDQADYPFTGGAAADAADTAAPDVADAPDTRQQSDAADADRPDAPDVADTSDAVDASDAADAADSPDAAVDGPAIIFTAIMPDSSQHPNASDGDEWGEYFEIKNVGTEPIDPAQIVVRLDDGRTIGVEEGVTPPSVIAELEDIGPGDYFVFVRRDTGFYGIVDDLAPGTFFQWGLHGSDVALTNSNRDLSLIYYTTPQDPVLMDTIAWAGRDLVDPTGTSDISLPMEEDYALGVRHTHETPTDNDAPQNWCYHSRPTPLGKVYASPGGPTPADCLNALPGQ